MTSKEALEMIRSIDGSISAEQTINECCNIIQKDLEVLNALKRNVGIRLAIQEWANKETKVFPNDRKIVKEWLNNEKEC